MRSALFVRFHALREYRAQTRTARPRSRDVEIIWAAGDRSPGQGDAPQIPGRPPWWTAARSGFATMPAASSVGVSQLGEVSHLSRSRFMPLTVPHVPVRRVPRSAPAPTVAGSGVVAGPDTRTDRRTGVRANTATAEILCLGLSISLATGQIHRLADTICDRVHASARPVGTVVLDLRAGADIDADSRAALLSLHRRLASMGTRLRIATACRQLAARLREDDLPRHLGADAIHDSVRSAVLATYAALPGPGLVTAQIRAALDIPVEAVDS
jgi:hypothetical protein